MQGMIGDFVRVGLCAAVISCVAACLGGCASQQAERDPAASGEAVAVHLLIVAVDGDRFENSTDARWLQSFLTNEARDVDVARSETDDLLAEASRRLRTAPGFAFMRRPMVVVEPGKRAMVAETMGGGSEMQIAIRPRLVGDGLYELSPTISLSHLQTSGDGTINGVTYRAPMLRYGTVPLTVPAGATRAVRMRKEIGSPIQPPNLQLFLIAQATPVE